MNITEMKQSLSQNLNRDFIEPPSQQHPKPYKPINSTTPWSVKDGGSPNRETQPLKQASGNPVVDDFSSSHSKISEEFNHSSSEDDEEERSLLVVDTKNQEVVNHQTPELCPTQINRQSEGEGSV